MGYTHYWEVIGQKDQAKYNNAINYIAIMVEAHKQILANGMGDGGTSPEFVKEISFNGINREGHEDFYLPLNVKDLRRFNFCKTAFKKYDKIVTASLVILHHFCSSFIRVSSDGELDDWQEGIKIASKYIGETKLPEL